MAESIGRRGAKTNDLTEEDIKPLAEFFSLLLKIDRRDNPHLYEKKKQKE